MLFRSDDPVSLETIANMKPPELREFISSGRDPRTGQPRRRKARGFGRTDNYIQHYAPVQLQPPTRRDAGLTPGKSLA